MGLSSAATSTTLNEALKFCIFDLRRGQHEGEELEKILFFYPTDLPFPAQLSVIGLSEGLITFTSLKLKSAKAKASALENKNLSRLGRTGLANMEGTWRGEWDQLVLQHLWLSVIQNDHSKIYDLAYLPKDKTLGARKLTEFMERTLRQFAEKEQNMLEDGTYHMLGRDPITQNPIPCDLLWPYPGFDFRVAIGKVYPTKDAMLHGSRMSEGYIKVQVDMVEDAYKAIPVPKMTEKVEQSVPSHPVTSEPVKPKQTQEERVKERLDILKHKLNLFQGSVKRFTKCKKKNISIVAPHKMYFKEWEQWIEYEAILDLYINAKVNISFIHWWAMHLHSVVKGLSENRCVFHNPHVIESSECLRNGTGSLAFFVVCLNLRRGYTVDSSKKENNEESYYFPKMVERAFEIKLDWTMVKINRSHTIHTTVVIEPKDVAKRLIDYGFMVQQCSGRFLEHS
nr:ulp1 protease family, C-terminal catalytic domain-containing protein [Tanacetum cinerariifolium]